MTEFEDRLKRLRPRPAPDEIWDRARTGQRGRSHRFTGGLMFAAASGMVALLVYLLSPGTHQPPSDRLPGVPPAPPQADKQAKPSEPQPEYAELMLLGVHPLWGGRNVFLKGDGTVVVQLVVRPDSDQRGLQEYRYETKLEKEKRKELKDLLAKHDFWKISVKERPGVPDEAQHSITLRRASGEVKKVSKWVSDKHPDFDPICGWLEDLAKKAEEKIGTELGQKGPYEHWRPQGFELYRFLTATGEKTGSWLRVGDDGKTLIYTSKDGKKLWEMDVIKECGVPAVGAPVIRHFAIKGGKVQAVFGKHSFADVDLATGKVTYQGSD